MRGGFSCSLHRPSAQAVLINGLHCALVVEPWMES